MACFCDTLMNTVINIAEFIRAFIPDLHICKFQEDPIKTEGLMVMTKSETDIFSSQDSLTSPVFKTYIYIFYICFIILYMLIFPGQDT